MIEYVICRDCNGSGEGRFDGSVCHRCRGQGEVLERTDEETIEFVPDVDLLSACRER